MYSFNVTRLALYAFLGVLAYFDEVRWWAPIALVMFDITVLVNYRTKKYIEQAQKDAAEYEQFITKLRGGQSPVPPLGAKDWN